MEPEGNPLTPGTSYGPPTSYSTQDSATPNFYSHTLSEASCSPNMREEVLPNRSPWSVGGDGGSQPRAEPGRNTQRTFRPSAFPSSLTWDSDSEKETLDEEELQHFSNPHGLAAHSPGSPSSGFRLDSEDDQVPEKLQPLPNESMKPSPGEDQDQADGSTKAEEPKTSQLSPTEPTDNKVWNVSERAELFLSKVKPKEGHQTKEEVKVEEDSVGKKIQKGKDTKQPERDVYTFPGDSDPESPPPAPWAHCTFIQRRRKKRALLRPFSGLGTWQQTSSDGSRRARGDPQRSKAAVSTAIRGRVYDFEETDLGEEVAKGPVKVGEESVKREQLKERCGLGGAEEEESGEAESANEIFTCVECSIYFKKQIHLQEHMTEHCQSGSGVGRRERFSKGSRFRCVECGWNLPNRIALGDHHRKHQESREKIQAEIEKLNYIGKAEERQGVENKVKEPRSPVPVTVQDATLVRGSDPDIATLPLQSPVPVSTEVSDPVSVLDPEPLPVSARAPPRARAAPANRRRLFCTKCDFSTRTSQALANHTKTHNRKKTNLQRNSLCLQAKPLVNPALRTPDSPTCMSSTSLACGHCAFLAPSQKVLREHLSLAHAGKAAISEVWPEEMGRCPRSSVDASSSKQIGATSVLDSDHLLGTGATPLTGPSEVKSQLGVTDIKDGAQENQTPNSAAACQGRELAFKCIGNKRANRKGKDWTELISAPPILDDSKLPEDENAQCEGQSTDVGTELNQKDSNSPAGLKPHTRARSLLDESSSKQHSSSSPNRPEKRSVKEEEGPEVEEDGKVLRRSTRVVAASGENDSDDEDDVDEEQMRLFLSEGILDEDEDEIDEETGALKSVERKCPYCPDRFHNGIGLANHVRGHLNRVGVSYNVRHFISPEEVNAIEKKFSYQKKKKKVANFDPDTFSVMRCEFCSAGFDTRAGLSSHARAHLRDFGITNWEVTVSPIHILRELFSSRPDLVIPTAPPRSPGSQPGDDEEEDEEEEDKKEMRQGELGGEKSERGLSGTASNPLSPASPQPWKSEVAADEPEGGEEGEEEGGEEDEEEGILALDTLSSSPGRKGLLSSEQTSLSPTEGSDTKVANLLKCEVCGAHFETRRGLSSHARSHLRQLGINVSESSGAPIDLLYQINKERGPDGELTPPLPEPPAEKTASPTTASTPQKDRKKGLEDMEFEEKPVAIAILAKAVKHVPPSSSSTPAPSPGASPSPSALGRSCSPSSVVRKAPISSLLPVSSPLRSLDHKSGGMKSLTSNFPAHATVAKPFWAPQDSDAPLNLTLEVDPNKDIICQLCGAWFETRKGLSSHARAHLRHFGVEYSESKGSPIDLLNQLIHTDDFKHKASSLQPESTAESPGLTALSQTKRSLFANSSSTSSASPLLYKFATVGSGSASTATSSSVSSLLGPPAKRSKSSPLQVFRLSSGEVMTLPHSEPPKEIGCEFCGEYFENRKGLSSHARSHLRQMGITEWSVNGSPIDTLREIITRRGLPCALPLRPLKTPPPSSPGPPRSPLSSSTSPPSAPLLGRLPFTFARPSSPQSAASKQSSAPPTSSAGLILKLKPEPVQVEVTMPGAAGGSGAFSSEMLNCSWSTSDNVFPLNLAMAHDVEPTRDIRCEFCGEYFENRKGLSSHARSHLRQMGITEWSVNGSPIDTLREIMHKRAGSTSSPTGQGVKKESSQEANSPPWEDTGPIGGMEGLGVSSFQSSKFRKSPISLLHSGSRLHKQGLSSLGLSATPPSGKFFRVSQLGKRPLSEEAHQTDTSQSPSHQLKTFSPLPHDFSFKRKSSPDKHATGHQDASCELCGFYFENRKALASHARAHLRQFGVTEWCVNGSPIETLSAWMRSRPQKVVDMHRSYMQGNRSTPKKKPSSSSSSSQWSALALTHVRTLSHEVSQGSSKTVEGEAGANLLAPPTKPSHRSSSPAHHSSTLPPQAQVARSELNVRLPRGFERRPLKHPSHPDGTERESGPPKPPRTGTVPALVPKPPSYPLVKIVGKFYTLKCRFCEVEFHGPLSVQEDWIRHLQQHILKMNYNKPATPRASSTEAPPQAEDPTPVQASVTPPTPASASTSSTTSTTPVLTSTSASTPTRTTAPSVTPPPPSRSPVPLAERPPPVTATQLVKVTEEQPPLTPPSTQTQVPIPIPTQAL